MSQIDFAASINAPSIPPRDRHRTIFETFNNLVPGTYMELTNDHDPKPVLYQFMMEYEGTYTWEYLEQGPEIWRVVIGKK